MLKTGKSLLISAFLMGYLVCALPIAHAQSWVPLSGNVTLNGAPVCAMVLANGQSQFSCNPIGQYSLTVPPDTNNQITLFAFADGMLPFRQVLGASQGHYDVVMSVCGGTATSSVTGALELVSVKEISGWAYDTAAISVPVSVKIFINGNSVATVQANLNLFNIDVGWDSWDYYYAFCDANRTPSCPNNIFFYKPLGWTWHSGDKVDVYAASQTGGGERLIGSQVCNIVCSNPHDITSCNLSCN